MSNGQKKHGTRKITAGTFGGAAATIAVWLLTEILRFEIPAEVTTALGTLVTASLVYMTSERYI
jgi:hypothetical protein